MQALACAGGDFETVNRTVREVAVAVAQAVTQAQVTCEHTGGEGSIACGFSSASVDAVATATVRRHLLASTKSGVPTAELRHHLAVRCGCAHQQVRMP